MPDKINVGLNRRKLMISVVLILATLAVYWQVNQFDFTNTDDVVYVTQNSRVQAGMTSESIRWSFVTTYAEFWHPLTWLSLMLDYEMHGLNAGGYHLTNLILHILSALLLFWLFHRMTGAIWKSAFVAFFFALHPLHVESVAWVAERKDVLSAFFFMLTLCFYVYYTEKRSIVRYLFVLFFFVCALMSKTIVVTLPAIMILLDYWPLKRFETRGNKTDLLLWQLKEKTLLFILSAYFSLLTAGVQYNITAINFPFISRLANAPVSCATYLEKTFWPHDMAFFYPFPAQFPFWQVWGAVFLIIGISIAAILTARRLPYFFVGWFWYAVTLLPVIGIIQVGRQAMADRYTYLPLTGIAICLAWGIPSLFNHKKMRRKILFPASIACLAALSVLSWQQCGYWKDSKTLLHQALQVTNDNYLAHHNLGQVLFEEGKTSEAIDHYNEAARIMPDHILIYNNRGVAYLKIGEYQQAIEDFSKAIHLMPNYADSYFKRGAVYLGQGHKEAGCRDARKACELGNCALLEIAAQKGDCR